MRCPVTHIRLATYLFIVIGAVIPACRPSPSDAPLTERRESTRDTPSNVTAGAVTTRDSMERSHREFLVSQPHASTSDEDSFPVVVRQPDGPPRITLAGADPQGRTASVACATCHSVRKPNLQNPSAKSLDEFHQGLQVTHGNLTCYSCHNPDNADTLRLASGDPLEYTDVMTLCSQCHGLQATAYAHGAHGGMNGYWDLSRGPQFKNNCIDCHDPHSPAYPKMVVDFKTRDRFLDAGAYSEHDAETQEATHDAHE